MRDRSYPPVDRAEYPQVIETWLNGAWARKLPVRTWWRRRRAVSTTCDTCGARVRLIKNTTAWAQRQCNFCATRR